MKNLTFCLALLLAALPALAEEDAANGWRELKSIFENSTALPIQSVLPENTFTRLNGKCFHKDGVILPSYVKPNWYIRSLNCVEAGEFFDNNDNIKPYCQPEQLIIRYSLDSFGEATDNGSTYSAVLSLSTVIFKFIERKQNKYMITQEKADSLFDDSKPSDNYCYYKLQHPPAPAEVEQAQEEPEKVSWLEWVENLLGL